MLFARPVVPGHRCLGEKFPVSEELLPGPGHEPAQSHGGPQLAAVQEVPGVHVIGGRQLQVQRQHRTGRGVFSGVGGVVVTPRAAL